MPAPRGHGALRGCGWRAQEGHLERQASGQCASQRSSTTAHVFEPGPRGLRRRLRGERLAHLTETPVLVRRDEGLRALVGVQERARSRQLQRGRQGSSRASARRRPQRHQCERSVYLGSNPQERAARHEELRRDVHGVRRLRSFVTPRQRMHHGAPQVRDPLRHQQGLRRLSRARGPGSVTATSLGAPCFRGPGSVTATALGAPCLPHSRRAEAPWPRRAPAVRGGCRAGR